VLLAAIYKLAAARFVPEGCVHAGLEPVPVEERSVRAAAVKQEHLLAASLELQYCRRQHGRAQHGVSLAGEGELWKVTATVPHRLY
jgi:hypothetical protein